MDGSHILAKGSGQNFAKTLQSIRKDWDSYFLCIAYRYYRQAYWETKLWSCGRGTALLPSGSATLATTTISSSCKIHCLCNSNKNPSYQSGSRNKKTLISTCHSTAVTWAGPPQEGAATLNVRPGDYVFDNRPLQCAKFTKGLAAKHYSKLETPQIKLYLTTSIGPEPIRRVQKHVKDTVSINSLIWTKYFNGNGKANEDTINKK